MISKKIQMSDMHLQIYNPSMIHICKKKFDIYIYKIRIYRKNV